MGSGITLVLLTLVFATLNGCVRFALPAPFQNQLIAIPYKRIIGKI